MKYHLIQINNKLFTNTGKLKVHPCFAKIDLSVPKFTIEAGTKHKYIHQILILIEIVWVFSESTVYEHNNNM